MEITHLAAFWQSLTTPTSRRGALAGIGGLLAAGPLALSLEEAAAKKRGKHRKRQNKKRKNKNKNKNKQRKTRSPKREPTRRAPSRVASA